MSATRPALSAAGCSHCRSFLLGLFTTNAPRSAPAIRSALLHTHPSVVARPIRALSSFAKPDGAEPGTIVRASEDGPENSDVPWYLQVEPPTHVAPIEPQALPEAPADAPPLVSSLLKYASEEMGLDELSLLDLRKLDPPPALGPNLMMLFGTARSERHLHVSAGRLVRWLRAKHRVHADADGLLGPNERKTKLRRKARRAKLLGTTGTDDADDGLRTGWICVNLGTVGRGGSESAIIGEDGRVSGFGVSHAGSTIVFQIMVESRRFELDLETLWSEALERSLSAPSKSQAKRAEASTREEKPAEKAEENSDPVESMILAGLHRPSNGAAVGRKGQSGGVVSPLQQTRFYSTRRALSTSALSGSEDPLKTLSAAALAQVLMYDNSQKLRLIELLRAELDMMDAQTARNALSEQSDGSQSEFLELAERAMEGLAPISTWGLRLAIHHKASLSEIPATEASLIAVKALAAELNLLGIQATRDQYTQLLSCLSYAMEVEKEVLVSIIEVLKTMDQRGEPMVESDLLVALIEHTARGPLGEGTWFGELTRRLEEVLHLPKVGCPSEPRLARLMTAYADAADWSEFLEVFRMPARHQVPRSSQLYRHLFRLASTKGNAQVCTRVVRRYIVEMGNETPRVEIDLHMRRLILDCIRVISPQAVRWVEENGEEATFESRLSRTEWAQLARDLLSHRHSATE